MAGSVGFQETYDFQIQGRKIQGPKTPLPGRLGTKTYYPVIKGITWHKAQWLLSPIP